MTQESGGDRQSVSVDATEVVGKSATSQPTPLALTVSGGVSMGAYEAGFLYYLTEWLKLNPGRGRLKVATGASAGSTNAFYALISSCKPPLLDPTRSLFWTWIDLGVSDIFEPGAATAVSMFSTKGARPAFREIRERWRSGLDARCDALYGASVTRLLPRHVRLAGSHLKVPRLEEHVTVHIKGRGKGKPPEVKAYPAVPKGAPVLQLRLPESQELQALLDVLTASSAFPIAFPPAPLRYCISEGGERAPCSEARSEQALFVDGGVFDNTPVSLAVQLLGRGLRDAEEGRWPVHAPDGEQAKLPAQTRLLVLAPGLALDVEHSLDENQVPQSVLPLVLSFFESFLATARSRELRQLVESLPELSEQIVIAPEAVPPMGSHLFAFFGFFERDLRQFDFALGMYEARQLLALHAELFPATAHPPRWVEAEATDVGAGSPWQALRCIRTALAADSEARQACAGEPLRDLRTLLQVSLEVQHQRCVRGISRKTEYACERASDGPRPLPVPGVPQRSGYGRGEQEGETAYVLRRLADHGFLFDDLGLSRDRAALAGSRIRTKLEELVGALARAQREHSLAEASAVRTLGRVAANVVAYQPPRYTVHLSVGQPWELGATGQVPLRNFAGLRWATGLQLWSMHTLVSSQRQGVGLAPVAGVELEPVRLNGPIAQLRLGSLGGYLLRGRDDYTRGSCDDPSGRSVDTMCSRPFVHSYVSLTVLEVLRLSMGATVFPRLARGDRRVFSIRPSIGAQLSFTR